MTRSLPHWRYRIDFILAENEVREPAPFAPKTVPAPPPGDRKKVLASYLAMSANHTDFARKWGDGKEIVGVNNIGEITFRWPPGDAKAVVQELWWRLQDREAPARLLTPFPLSKAIVSLHFNDAKYPQPSPCRRGEHMQTNGQQVFWTEIQLLLAPVVAALESDLSRDIAVQGDWVGTGGHRRFPAAGIAHPFNTVSRRV